MDNPIEVTLIITNITEHKSNFDFEEEYEEICDLEVKMENNNEQATL